VQPIKIGFGVPMGNYLFLVKRHSRSVGVIISSIGSVAQYGHTLR
jgi:hypothetical protein